MFKNLNAPALGLSGHQSEVIELALTYGFTGIDVNMVEFATRVRLKGMPYARRLIQSAKVRVGSFALPIEWDGDDAAFSTELKKLPEYAQCAAELGCTRCTAMLAPAGDARPYHENFELHRRRLHEICDVLKPSGVSLAVGFQAVESLRRGKAFEFIHDLDATNLLINMVSASNIGLLLDTWEVVACGSSIEAVGKLSAKQIIAVQVADMPAGVAPADLDEKSRLLPGAENGQVDVAAFLSQLKTMGYDGPVTVKPSRTVFQSRRRDVIAKQTAEALEKVWRAADLPSTCRPNPATANA
ncbi:MAG: sugar phosphate isomerase/epimerase [Planctomycetaceae bacterium]|nr:sugar phosphate isomerase/epimerase [Planctomycetaceae bacterium]